MAELLLEIFSEEIPARMQKRAADDLLRLVTTGLKEAKLEYKNPVSHVTPRRLVLKLEDLPLAQEDVVEEKRGPKVGAPEKAVQGFLRSAGLTLEQAEIRDTKKGEFYFAVIEKKGRASVDVIKEVVKKSLENFSWPKSMRWGENKTRWVRPLHSMICLFDKEVVPVEFAGKIASNKTRGHRFLAPNEITVSNFDDYQKKLEKAFVIIDREQRKQIIATQSQKLAQEEELEIIEDNSLLDEVCGLVEYPVALIGKIDDEFMQVPQEALISSMSEHQKYFSLCDKKTKKMAPRFIVISNMSPKKGSNAIVSGNERVLRARLSDGKFFWDNDRKNTLESRVPKLMERIFHAKLGTDFDKVQRIQKLSGYVSEYIKEAKFEDVKRAALLSKADLTSEMVGEFADLQGIMGRYYAINDNEKQEISQAIAEHYSPKGPSDDCPKSPTSVAVAIADKIDTLVGFWLIDEKPTGSKDPYALRRATLGVIRLIIENNLRISLSDCLKKACDYYFEQANEKTIETICLKLDEKGSLTDELKHKYVNMQIHDLVRFFAERLKVYLKDRGVSHDLISSVFEKDGKLEDDLVRLLLRVEALKSFLVTDDGSNLLTAYRRAANIVRIEEKKDKTSYKGDVTPKLFEQDEEKALFESIKEVSQNSDEKISNERFEEAMGLLARLRSPVDAFFERVTVNCDNKDLRANRLKLLNAIVSATDGVANFQKIES